MISIDIATSLKDINDAFDLCLKSFPSPKNLKTMTWSLSSDMHSNFVIAKKNKHVIGLIRLVPVKMKVNKIVFNACALTSICVDEAERGQGIFKSMMTYADAHLMSLNIDMSFLIARKKLDYSYLDFGFISLSCYHSLKINEFNKNINFNENIHLKPGFISENINLYQKAHIDTYSNLSGYIERDRKHWSLIEARTNLQGGLFFFNFYFFNKFAGYFVVNDEAIVEITSSLPHDYVDQFLYHLSKEIGTSNYRLPANHGMLSGVITHDYTLSTRFVSFGGHLVKPISRKAKNLVLGLSNKTVPNICINYLDEI